IWNPATTTCARRGEGSASPWRRFGITTTNRRQALPVGCSNSHSRLLGDLVDKLDGRGAAVVGNLERDREDDCANLADAIALRLAIVVIKRNLQLILAVAVDPHGHFEIKHRRIELRAAKSRAISRSGGAG